MSRREAWPAARAATASRRGRGRAVKRWVLAADMRSLSEAAPVRGVRLLPSFDQLLVMSAPYPEAMVDEAFRDRAFRPRIAVWSLPCVLVDGRIRAAWRIERKRDHAVLTVEPFVRLARRRGRRWPKRSKGSRRSSGPPHGWSSAPDRCAWHRSLPTRVRIPRTISSPSQRLTALASRLRPFPAPGSP